MKLKSWIVMSVCTLGAVVASGAWAQSTGMSAKQTYACEVAMCMSNPAGPMAVQECVPPIKKLYKDLAKGKPFPHCNYLSGGTTPGGGKGVGGGNGGCPTNTRLMKHGCERR